MKTKEEILQWIQDNKDEFINISTQIWEKPELGMEEIEASRKLVDLLLSHGFQVDEGVAGMPTAFVASYGSGSPVLGFSSEYDALPGVSQKKGSVVHDPILEGAPGQGCGHNLLAVSGILGAIALKTIMMKNHIPGTLKIFGTPAEELCIGKPFMAREGLFEGVDAFIDWHPFFWNKVSAGDCNAYFNVYYHFKGKTSHGNAPWFGRSTLDAGMLAGHAIEMLREHIRPGSEDSPSTLNYAFPDVGNSFPNVIPDRTTLWCIGRVKDAELASDVMERVDRCAEGAAIATGTTVEKEVITATHDMIPNLRLAKIGDENFRWIGAPEYTEQEQSMAKEIQKNMGIPETGFSNEILPIGLGSLPVSDASEYSWFAPYMQFNVAIAPSSAMGWHNWAVAAFAGSSIGEKAILTAAKLIGTTGYDLLNNPEIILEAKEEHKERLNGKSYQSLIPENIKPSLTINKSKMDRFR